MDARKYEVIIKAAECGNLTRAGEDFGYTQSGVSHMIKAVETEFGFRIFLRGRGGVTLTEEGSRVLPYLREIVKWNERLTQTVSSLSGLITGTLRIGSFSSIAAHWLPQIIKRFQSDYPNIKIEITEGGTDALGEVRVRIKAPDGREFPGKGISTDIIKSSIRAYINAINRAMIN